MWRRGFPIVGRMCKQQSRESHPGQSKPQAWSQGSALLFPSHSLCSAHSSGAAPATGEGGGGLVALCSLCPEVGGSALGSG